MPIVELMQPKKNAFQKLFSKKKPAEKMKVAFQNKGIIEACYHPDTAKELMFVTTAFFANENVAYVIACNHLLLRRAGLASKLQDLAGFSQGGLQNQMDQAFTKYISDNSDATINLSYANRRNLVTGWTAIRAGTNVRALIVGRWELVGLLSSDTLNHVAKKYRLTKKLATMLNTSKSPTDDDVMWRLNLLQADTQAPSTRTRAVANTTAN